jgi:hypothetical protein
MTGHKDSFYTYSWHRYFLEDMRIYYCASRILRYTGLEICVVIKLLDGFYGLKNKVGDKDRATSNSPMKLC